MVRRRFSFQVMAVVFCLALVAAACGGDDDDGSSGSSGTSGGTVAENMVIGTTESLQNSFDPAQAYDFFGFEVVGNTAETLVTYEPNKTSVSPLLAKELPVVSADGLTYTFELRDGVKFTDGMPLDSAAVKFSLERARDFGAKDAEAAGFLLSGITAIDTPSPTTVVIHLSTPNQAFLARLAYTVASIVSPTAYKDNLLAGDEESDSPAVLAKYKSDTIVGSGRYKIVSYKEKESIELEANPDYWGDQPKTKRILLRLFDKSSALKLALENGEVDVAFRSLQPDENNAFKNKNGFKLIEGEGPGIRYITFNTTSEPFKNVNLRRAVAAAVDRQAVVDEVLKGSAKALPTMVPPPFSGSKESWTEMYGDGPAKDKVDQYLKAAGVPDGQKVDLDFWFSPTHYGDTEAAVAQVLARSLEDTGRFTVKISNVEWAEYGQKRRAGEMPIFLMGWYPDYLDEDDYLEPFSDPKVFDPAKWEDQKMLDMVHKAQGTQDAAARTQVYKDAQDYMADQAPYVPIFQISQFAAVKDSVSGVVLDPIQLLRLWLLEKKA
ncbi:MAG TPA: ABC transporter substrate-binding protein [Acidimicrobiales bacterium]|nr:ABC transporter substrate-binding protein [Acidimicrobiales bacterium]